MPVLQLYVPNDLMRVLHYLEDTCAMGCCGPGCLDISAKRILEGIEDHNLNWAKRGLASLDTLIEKVESHSGPVVSDINNLAASWKSSQDALLLLSKVKSALVEAVDKGSRLKRFR